MNFKYPKSERLKSRKTIDALFTQGKSVTKYPLRLVFVATDENTPTQVGVSVSKKYFKKAVDRNYFKRVLRETYRLNKHLLSADNNQNHAFMLLYQSKDRLAFDDINAKTVDLFQKFNAQLNAQSDN